LPALKNKENKASESRDIDDGTPKPRLKQKQRFTRSTAHFFRALIAAYQFRQRFANFSKKQRPAPQF